MGQGRSVGEWLCEGDALLMQDDGGHGREAWWCDAHAEGEALDEGDAAAREPAIRPPVAAG